MANGNGNKITFIGRTDFRNTRRLFGIKTADRRAHLYLIGKTGTGKSRLMETMMMQDMVAGHGFGLLDPHGDLLERVLAKLPARRKDDLIYFSVPDASRPLGFNPLENIPAGKRPLAASGLLEVFKKIWADFWGPRSEHILRNALLALLDQPEATLADILRLLDDVAYRKHAVARVSNAQVRNFWLREYESYPARFRAEAIAPPQNKVGAFVANPILHRIITQPKSAFDLRSVMDEGKILLVNLAKGLIGDDVVALLGSLLVGKMGLAALSRSDVPEETSGLLSLLGRVPELHHAELRQYAFRIAQVSTLYGTQSPVPDAGGSRSSRRHPWQCRHDYLLPARPDRCRPDGKGILSRTLSHRLHEPAQLPHLSEAPSGRRSDKTVQRRDGEI